MTRPPTLPRPSLLLGLATAIAVAVAAIAAGCGEKAEPEPSAVPPPSSSGSVPAFEIIGTWEGRLQQRGTKPFRVTATIAALDDSRDNRVSYTGIDCTGHWKYLGRNPNSYTFREFIDEGEGKACKGIGTVRLTPLPDGRLDYLFRGGGVVSRGVLTKTSG